MADVPVPRNHDYRLGAVNEFSEVNRWGSEVDARLVEIINCLGQSVKRVNILTTKSTPGSIGAHAPQHFPQTGFDPLQTAAHTGLYGATATVGTSDDLLRADARFRWPNALTEYSFNSTITLTSDGTAQTLTGSLGDVHLRSASKGITFDWWTSAGGLNTAFPGTILTFSASTLNTSTALTTGVNGSITIASGTHVGTTFRGFNIQVSTTGSSFTSINVRGCDVIVGTTGSLIGTNTFLERIGYRCTVNPALQSGGGPTTVTDTFGYHLTNWSTIGNSATHTNVASAKLGFPTVGATIRRGVWVSTQTTNLGTEPASVEGFYCEAMTRANVRYSYWASGATTGTPVTCYSYYSAGHTVGNGRYGFYSAAHNTGAPITTYAFFAEPNSVGTNRWAFFGNQKIENASTDFIASQATKGLITVGSSETRYWRINAESTGTGTGDAYLVVDANQILSVTRAAAPTGNVKLNLYSVGTSLPTT